MSLSSFLKSLHPFPRSHKPRGEWDRPWLLWSGNPPELARPIEGTPFVTESIDTVIDHYMRSPGFVTGDRYPRDVKMAEGEIGYWAVYDGLKIWPVARVLVADGPTGC